MGALSTPDADPGATPGAQRGFYRAHGKRALDIAISFVALVLLAPVLGLVALLVRVALGSPVLFRQERPGLHGRIFLLAKFRTMREGGDDVPIEDRVGPVGRFLRSASLDELPELWHVLKGEMSLVGPRPLLVEYLPRYSPEQARRHDVPPGLTGWSQVHGRNSVTWEDRFKADVWYVDHQSFRLDLKILALTVGKVLGRKDIVPEGQSVMPKFTGSPKP